MPEHTFKKTTAVGDKVFFKGKAHVSDRDAKAIEAESGGGLEGKTKTELLNLAAERGVEVNQSMTKAEIISALGGE